VVLVRVVGVARKEAELGAAQCPPRELNVQKDAFWSKSHLYVQRDDFWQKLTLKLVKQIPRKSGWQAGRVGGAGRLKPLEIVWTKEMIRTGAGAALLQVSLATIATVVITLSVPPAASRPPNQVLKIGAGCCSSPSSALVRLRGGSSNAEDEAPWREVWEEGGVHDEAGDLASAVASYTRGLKYDSTPPNGAAALYYSRALALLKQESFVEAAEDARACLAIFEGESLNPEGEGPEIKRNLFKIAREADHRQAIKHHNAGEWASAIASYTRALACESAPPNTVATIHADRAEAFLQQGSFGEAGEDARAGLAVFSGGESFHTPGEAVLNITQRLESIVRDADLGMAVEKPRPP